MTLTPSLLKFVRFGLVGGIVTLVFMGLNGWFAPRLGADGAYFAAYPLAVGLHFFLNKCWTFRAGGPVRRRQVSEYLVMMAIAFCVQTAVFKALLHFTALPSWTDSGVATVAQMGFSFVVLNRRVFARESPAAPAGAE